MTDENQLVFLPLGGAGEIGMNLNLYGFGRPGHEQWIMIDLGVTFGDSTLPGVDVIMPDPSFIEERRDSLLGIVLTHAHEDHLGAVQYLWPRLRCPVYATPFTAAVLRRKLSEARDCDDIEIIELPLGGNCDLGPFSLELISLTHSIPEPNAIAIRTPVGMILHTGDWKFDDNPVIGAAPDFDRLSALGDDGILALVGDSTNVFTPGDAGSEGDLEESLTRIVRECTGRVAVACFASNVARLQTIHAAATAAGRDVVLAGRSLRRMIDSATETGYLSPDLRFLTEDDAGYLPRERALIICTGSQGEPRAALSRIAANDHPRVSLEEGDTVIFSSRVIPGNEVSIGALQNDLVRRGIRLITWRDDFVHVSGHPARDELARMYQLARPRIAVPVHGEYRHLAEHARLAADCQVAETVICENGALVRLAPGKPGVVSEVTRGRIVLEGNRLIPIDGDLLRSRKRALFNGIVVASIAIDEDGDLVADPVLTTSGLIEANEPHLIEDGLDVIEDVLGRLPRRDRQDDATVQEAVRVAVRRYFRDTLDKKPVTDIHVLRIPFEDEPDD
ncbi:MAG: ribonuclease J [Rhodospirillales bacterium]